MQPEDRLGNRSFIFFVFTQYFGAFNDNIFKQLLLLMVVTGQDRQGLVTMIFALPFLLFAGVAGQASERYSKTQVMRLSKVAELAIMLLALVGFYMGSQPFLMVVLFLMGAQSTFFGPAKYGVIPELVTKRLLIPANGIIQMTTFAAVILGVALAGQLKVWLPGQLYLASLACVGVALVGIVTVVVIRKQPANLPELRFSAASSVRTLTVLREMFCDKPLTVALIANAYFFFSGALVIQIINNYGTNLLDLKPNQVSMLLVFLTFGIMIGCMSAAQVRRRIGVKGTILLGAVGVAVTEFALTFYGMPLPMIRLILFLAGVFTGFYFVPIAAFLQSRPPLGKKGEVLAAVNFTSFVGILLSGAFWEVLMRLGVAANWGWVFLAIGLAAILIYMLPSLEQLDSER